VTTSQLSPNDPLAYLFLSRLARAHYHLGCSEEVAHYATPALAVQRLHFVLVIILAQVHSFQKF